MTMAGATDLAIVESWDNGVDYLSHPSWLNREACIRHRLVYDK